MQSISPQTSAAASGHPAREANLLRSFAFTVYATMAVVVSYFPLYFADRGYSGQQIGVLYSISPAMAIIANLIMGTISDRLRTIKWLLALLMLGQLAAIGLLFPSTDYMIVCCVMVLFYFCQTPVNPLIDSMILLSLPHTGRNYPSIRIFGSAGFAFSALVVGFFLKEQGVSTTMAVCLVTIGISLSLSFLLRDYQGSMKKPDFSGFYAVIRKPELLSFLALAMIVSIGHRMNDGFLAVMLRQMGANETVVGYSWMISATSEIPVFYLLGKYGHKFRELPLLAAAAAYVVRFWLLSDISDPHWAIPIQAMHSITFGIFFSTSIRYLGTLIPDEYRATGQALFTAVWTGAAGLISGLLGGYVFDHAGPHRFYQMAALLSAVACAGFLYKHVRGK